MAGLRRVPAEDGPRDPRRRPREIVVAFGAERGLSRRAVSHRTQLQIAVFTGGTVGALARAGLGRWFPFDGHGWPWATFVANLVGTGALGYFITRLQERLPPSTFRRPLLGTGFCGALTTFSTLQIEVIKLARHGEVSLAVGYLVATVSCGLAVVYAATALTRRARVR